ncbi:hypothetical protein EVAR_2961_1 [Eumeta japonica]|uniref:Uncharacterized protein n=1 Tax=Eumeta variegata TaxID=151549 RepID=A0A4C1T125_EUMVA|nr:hypothetical protein EVAR_2961_1 [Eumeta japonica]
MQRFAGDNSNVVYAMVTGIEVLAHLPYLSDFASCDFYLFSKIKVQLQGKRFTDAEEAVAAYEKAVEATPNCQLGCRGSKFTDVTLDACSVWCRGNTNLYLAQFRRAERIHKHKRNDDLEYYETIFSKLAFSGAGLKVTRAVSARTWRALRNGRRDPPGFNCCLENGTRLPSSSRDYSQILEEITREGLPGKNARSPFSLPIS